MTYDVVLHQRAELHVEFLESCSIRLLMISGNMKLHLETNDMLMLRLNGG